MGEKARSKAVGCGIAALVPVVLVGLAAVMLVVNNRQVKVTVPARPAAPKDNGFDYFVGAGDQLDKVSGYTLLQTPRKPQTWTSAEFGRFLSLSSGALAVCRQGLAKPSLSRGINNGGGKALGLMYSVGRALRAEAVYYERQGDYGRAVNSRLDCIELGLTIPRGGTVFHEITGASIAAMGYVDMQKDLARLNKGQLAHAAARMIHIRQDDVPYSDVVLESGRATVEEYSELLSHPGAGGSIYNPNDWIGLYNNLRRGPAHGSVASDYSDVLKLAFANKGTMVSQAYERSKKLAAEAKKPYAGSWKTPSSDNLLCKAMDDMTLRVWQYHLRCEAAVALLETEIAVRRYQADNGRYPDRLRQLVPKYLKSVPVDPFGKGKALRYQTTDAGKSFIMYSLGQDMVDNGGSPVNRGYIGGDIVLEKVSY